MKKLSKEDVLNNLDQVKTFVSEIESEVKTKKKVDIQIKNRWTGDVIFESEKTTYQDVDLSGANLRDANLCGADLSGADLCDANLCGADLSGADLCGAELCNAKFYGKGGTKKLKKSQVETFLKALGFIVEN